MALKAVSRSRRDSEKAPMQLDQEGIFIWQLVGVLET
jgi:hypothetical protein